jgi:septal ring factor EnvC (AmiA/AmiB activator)
VRIVLAALIVALIFIGAGYLAWRHIQAEQAAERADLQKQIGELERERDQFKADDDKTKAALDKVQAEEERMAVVNEELTKTLQQAQLTGKIPPPSSLPFPPK